MNVIKYIILNSQRSNKTNKKIQLTENENKNKYLRTLVDLLFLLYIIEKNVS